ncbi:MAG: hypothetical protein WCF67_17450 [Chitinophagaceae bacterium]
MIDEMFNPANWTLISIPKQLEIANRNTKRSSKSPVQAWFNSAQKISPLLLYSYLQARFGPPNGFVMLLKNASSDNLIHWQYSIAAPQSEIHIWGKTAGLEITIKSDPEIRLSEKDWDILISNLLSEFKKYHKQMKDVQSEFEHWALFINPFARIEHTIKDYVLQLERLNLKEVGYYKPGSRESYEQYMKELRRWTKNINKAAAIGTTIRMLCPVMAEAFVNLILLLFRKEEYKEDERLYDSLLRQQIDIRVKTLHIHCTCFPKQIDSGSSAFRNFHSLMNRRNDFLHGNIDPKRLFVEEVWFDHRFIPLFEKDEGVIRKMMRHYCANVEPENAIGDFQAVSDFIELVLMAMDDSSLHLFVQLLADRMPGINKKTKRLGVLFPSQYLVENYIVE